MDCGPLCIKPICIKNEARGVLGFDPALQRLPPRVQAPVERILLCLLAIRATAQERRRPCTF